VYLTASGPSGSNVALALSSRATGAVRFYTNTVNQEQMRVSHTASAVNYVQVTGGATTKAVIQSSQGSDSNISFVTQTKGTGAIDLAAGSSGVNISNGGTVTAITRTAAGSGYSLPITITVSAPTTAGGVQAQVSLTSFGSSGATVVSGGTGYTNGDVLTISGGTPSGAATYTVTGVSGGAVTSVSALNSGAYTTAPTNPVSVTGGTGSGATLNLTYYVPNTFTITNAGSGYVEQPTVTFSGGGGSGAAAYATVGSGTVVRSIGSTMDFYTPSGRQFQVSEAYTTAPVNYVQISGRVSGAGPVLSAVGADTNITMNYVSKGTGDHFFITNSGSVNQFRVAHTASAVNYVQVTGAATGGRPTIIAQGSDTNINFVVASKGSGSVGLRTDSSTTQVSVIHTASAVNFLTLTGSAAGSSPVIASAGSDTNIDINLTPKGTGNVVASAGQIYQNNLSMLGMALIMA
jgi:hypothetical protein